MTANASQEDQTGSNTSTQTDAETRVENEEKIISFNSLISGIYLFVCQQATHSNLCQMLLCKCLHDACKMLQCKR